MPTRKLEIQLIGDDESLSRALKRSGSNSETLGSKLKSAAAIGAKALGGVLVAGAAAATYGIGKSAEAAEEANKVHQQTAAVLKSTGHAANVTKKDVEDLAGAISRKTGIDDEAVQTGANLLLTFKDIRNEAGKGNDIFDQSTQTIVDMSAALDQDLKSSAIQVGKALNDPIKGLTALQRVGVSFSEQKAEQIKQWTEEGDKIRAQKAILKELNSEFGGSAEAQATAMDKVKVSLGNVEESLGNVFLPYINDGARLLNQDFVPELQHTADTLDRIARRKNIDLGEKLKLSGAAIRRDWGDVPEEIGHVVDEAIPIVAQRAGKIGVAMAEGTLQGFVEADPLGKAVIALSATKVVGGPVAAAGLGKSLFGRQMGEAEAGFIGAGLRSKLPAAMAAVGVGNVVTSAASGDLRDAGFEAGGMLIGGIVGAFAGNPLIGAGIGSVAGELGSNLFGSLFSSEKQLTPLQARLRAEAERTAASFLRQRDAIQGLRQAEQGLTQANRRHSDSTQDMQVAHQRLNAVVRKFGPESAEARRAELQLASAQHKDAETAREAEQAHRRSGNALKLYKIETADAVHAEKLRIPALRQLVDRLRQRYSQDESNVNVLQRLVHAEGALRSAHDRVNAALKEAAQVVNPKWAKTLAQSTRLQDEFGQKFHGLIRILPEFGQTLKGSVAIGGGAVIDYRGTVHRSMQAALGDTRSYVRGTRGGFREVESALNQALGALGVKSVTFGTGGGKEGRARGGEVRQRQLYEVGEEAPQHHEWVIATNPAYRADNVGYWMAAGHDLGIPGFAKGGEVTEPHLRGPVGGFRVTGQEALHGVTIASRAYLQRVGGDRTFAAIVSNANRMDALHQPYLWGGGHGATASVNGPWDCSGAISELFNGAGWNFAPMVSGGFESWGQPGKGKVSVLANADHVYAVLGSRAFGTSGENPGGGAGWISGYTYRGGFTVRHADLLNPGALTGGLRGKGQKQKQGFARGGLIGKFAKGGLVSGKVSWFQGGATAGGKNTSQPGVALNLHPGTDSGWNNETTQGWMADSRAGHPDFVRVTIAGHSANLPIIDLGPAGSTGRAIDVTEGGVHKLGFTPDNFPTDAIGTATLLGSAGGKASKKEPPIAGLGKAIPLSVAPLHATPLLPSAKGLSQSIRHALRAPGLDYAGKVGIGEMALERAEATEGAADNEAVLNFQEDLYKRNKKRLQKALKAVDSELKHRQSAKARQRSLGKRQHIEEELRTVEGNLGGARSARAGLDEEEADNALQEAVEKQTEVIEAQRQAEEAQTAAIKDLQASIDHQNQLAQSEMAIGLVEARRALADLISGELGPRIDHQAQTAGSGNIGTLGGY